jgi:hypothetical protein
MSSGIHSASVASASADFVPRRSIVRTIWGNPDLVLLIFAGSAAEFALNRAVDWLFFTGEIPRDPIGRLFSTVRYAQEIVFGNEETARRTLDESTRNTRLSRGSADKRYLIGRTATCFTC